MNSLDQKKEIKSAPLSKKEKNLAMFSHLLPLLGAIIPLPLVCSVIALLFWQLTKKKSEFVNHHGKEAFIFNVIAFMIGLILFMFFVVGLLIPESEQESWFTILVIVFVVYVISFIVFAMIAAVKARNGLISPYFFLGKSKEIQKETKPQPVQKEDSKEKKEPKQQAIKSLKTKDQRKDFVVWFFISAIFNALPMQILFLTDLPVMITPLLMFLTLFTSAAVCIIFFIKKKNFSASGIIFGYFLSGLFSIPAELFIEIFKDLI